MTNTQNVRAGADAYDRDGERIGTIEEVGTNYFLVTKGLIFPKDIYVPFTVITAVTEGEVRLDVSKDQIDDMGWDDVPAETDMTARGDAASVRSESTYDTDATTVEDRDSARLSLREEQLRAQVVPEQTGEVAVRKNVVEEEQTLDVPVTSEQVEVRRYAVDKPASEAEIVEDGDTIRVPVMAERVQVDKEVRVAEEIEIDKRKVTDTERVAAAVRREEVDISGTGGVETSGVSRSDADFEDR
jgi:uncharacterized protein (TIGR02271 family)